MLLTSDKIYYRKLQNVKLNSKRRIKKNIAIRGFERMSREINR